MLETQWNYYGHSPASVLHQFSLRCLCLFDKCEPHLKHSLFVCCCCFCFIYLFCNFWIWLSDVNDCEKQPCKNGGQCRDLDGDYSCQCPSPYVGKQCQLRTCTTIRHTHFKHGQPVVTRFASTFFKELKDWWDILVSIAHSSMRKRSKAWQD